MDHTPRRATRAWVGPGQSQDTGILWVSHVVVGTQVLAPCFIASLGALAGSWVRSAAARSHTGRTHMEHQFYEVA